ncbi:MAG: flagellar biosynthesis protein FliQ [Candidatus Omnitrophica bacterium]|nr:flagellar biosynthesis protein FliQ [Candidatus Omnitrophota bacterium]
MTETFVMALGQKALVTYLHLAGPILLFALSIGLMVSVAQAVTQIQDMTLTFIPKILATLLALVIFGQFMLRSIVQFTYYVIVSIPNIAQ